MSQKSKYEIEIDSFRRAFSGIKHKRIAIYGIGRRSATLLPGITDYNIVGLLDRDAQNIGKELCGIPIISTKNLEVLADIIIINSDPSNYQIIYKRIAKDISLPIYYANGEAAHIDEKDTVYCKNPYWNSSYSELKAKIDAADIVSFDIFDTLVMRKLFSPEDIFRLLEEQAQAQSNIQPSIARVRASIAAQCNPCASIHEIYKVLEKQTTLTAEDIISMKNLEQKIDLELCVARKDMAALYEYSIAAGKDVYLISDMYYTLTDVKKILQKCGIVLVDDSHIWISCEKKLDKASESIWLEYTNQIGRSKRCLHIGDNPNSDVIAPAKYGIDTYYVMSGKDMLLNSSLSALASSVNTVSDSICLGLVVAEIFNSPFALCKTKGKVVFTESDIYGYCVYGPLLEKFLIWLYYNSRKDGIDKLLFFARDGYFLQQDYQLVSESLTTQCSQEWCYLPISRRLIYLAAMENDSDFEKIAAFPYVGTFAEYMKSRFEITVTNATAEYNNRQINAVGNMKQLLEWIKPYKKDILKEASFERKNYLNLLQSIGITQQGISYGTVDAGYYGTNQYYLQKLTQLKMQGYCFYSCLDKKNEYTKEITMKGCFQYGSDYTADASLIKQKAIYVESFITAPHGMIKYIDEAGNMVCEPDKKSQHYFPIKEKANSGVRHFISDYLKLYKNVIIYNNDIYTASMETRTKSMEDVLFYQILSGTVDISKDILKGFYWDNDFVGSSEIELEI